MMVGVFKSPDDRLLTRPTRLPFGTARTLSRPQRQKKTHLCEYVVMRVISWAPNNAPILIAVGRGDAAFRLPIVGRLLGTARKKGKQVDELKWQMLLDDEAGKLKDPSDAPRKRNDVQGATRWSWWWWRWSAEWERWTNNTDDGRRCQIAKRTKQF